MEYISHRTWNNELEHHGIKGQRWGVRRSQETLDRLAGRYREKEHRKNEKRFTKEKNRYSKAMSRLSGEETSETRIIKREVKDRYANAKRNYRNRKKTIERMTTDDYVMEKRLKKKEMGSFLKGAALTTAKVTAGQMIGTTAIGGMILTGISANNAINTVSSTSDLAKAVNHYLETEGRKSIGMYKMGR